MTETVNYAERFGIVPTNDPVDNLARLLFAFNGAMDTQDALSEESESGKKELREIAKKDDAAKKEADDLEIALRNYVFAALDENAGMSTFLVEILRNIVDDVLDVELVVLDAIARKNKKAPVTSSEVIEAREVAEWTKENITKMFTLLPMFGVDPESLDWFPVKINKGGEVVPQLRNLKSGPRENAGKDAVIKRFSYKINGEEVPSGISMHEVAVRYCSTPVKRWDGKQLKDAIDKVNEGKSLKETEKFEVTVPTGTLVGEMVTT